MDRTKRSLIFMVMGAATAFSASYAVSTLVRWNDISFLSDKLDMAVLHFAANEGNRPDGRNDRISQTIHYLNVLREGKAKLSTRLASDILSPNTRTAVFASAFNDDDWSKKLSKIQKVDFLALNYEISLIDSSVAMLIELRNDSEAGFESYKAPSIKEELGFISDQKSTFVDHWMKQGFPVVQSQVANVAMTPSGLSQSNRGSEWRMIYSID